MKKILSTLAALSALSMNFVAAKTELVSIDSILIMQKSKEGQEVAKRIQNDVEKFQKEVEGYQKELVDMQEGINKQSKALSKEALQEKNESLVQKKKDIERKLGDREEALKVDIQKKQYSLREKQLATIGEISQKEEWGVLVDRNTPGVLYVSNAIDKTDYVLKAVDEKFESSKTTKAPAVTTKTAATAVAPSEKKTIKAA